MALSWLGMAPAPLGTDVSLLDVVSVTLIDGRAIEGAIPTLELALAGLDAPLALAPGDAAETAADVTPALAEPKPDLAEPLLRSDEPAVNIDAAWPLPRLPRELPVIEPQRTPQAASSIGGATSRSAVSAPGAASATGAARGIVDTYKSSLAIALSKAQPANRGTPGTVYVAFTVGTGGALDEASVTQSSGHATLDQSALGAVRRARLPAPNGTMTREQRTFSMRYVFK